MPLPPKKNRPAPKVVREESDESTIDGETFNLRVSVSVTISANYQSIRLEAGIEHKARTAKKDTAYENAWSLCNKEIASQLRDAKETLESLGA